MRPTLLLAALLFLGAASPSYAQNGRASAADAQSGRASASDTIDTEQWAGEIAEFRKADRLHPPRPGGVVFVGSSSIRLWPDLAGDFPGVNVIQRGFGGAELVQVVYRAPKIVTPYRPRLIVLYAGDNDIAAGATPQQVFDRYKSFVRLVRESLPNTRIAFISIKPSGARAEWIGKAKAANALIKEYATSHPRLSYVDVFTPMLDSLGRPRAELFDVDRLHLNSSGYALWRQILEPVVRGPSR